MADAVCSANNLGFPWPSAWGASGMLKIISDREFVSNGKAYPSGRISDPINQNFCYQSAITVAASVATFAAITLPQTDASDVQVVNGSGTPRYTAIIYSNNGNTKRQNLFSDWHLSFSLGASFNFAAWCTDNNAPTVINPRSQWVDIDTLNRALAAIAYAPASTTQLGLVEVDTVPVDTSRPVAIGQNSRTVSDFYRLTTYGALTTNTTTQNATAIAAANAAASSAGAGIYWPVGYIPTNSVTITVPCLFAPGNSGPQPANGQTVTFTKSISIPDYAKHFANALAGQGTISFAGNRTLRELCPEWWGALGDSATDCSPAFIATIAASKTVTLTISQDAGVPIVWGAGEYLFNSNVPYTAANNSSVVIRGQGYSTVFLAGADITMLTVNQGNSSNQGLEISGIYFDLNLKDAAAIDGTLTGQSALLKDLWVLQPSLTGTKKLVMVGADTITITRMMIAGSGTAGSLTNTNVGLYLSHIDSYRMWITNLNIYLCQSGFASDNTHADGGNFGIVRSTFHGNDVGINLGSVGGGTGLAQSNWLIGNNHFESNLTNINLKGFSGSFPLKNVTIADNYQTGLSTGFKGIVAQSVDGLSILRNRYRSGASGDHSGVALTLMSGITNARIQGNLPFSSAFAPDMTISGNSTASPSSGPVFTSAVLSTDQVSLDLLEAPQKHPVATLAYSATIATDASVAESVKLTVTNGTAFTLSSPTGAVTTGQLLTYDILNSSGGAMGTITWGAAFLLSAFSNPANGKRKTITFRWDGTNWVQQGAASPDL